MRQRMKQERPKKIERTIRNAPVLLLKSDLFGVGARSACVTAIDDHLEENLLFNSFKIVHKE